MIQFSGYRRRSNPRVRLPLQLLTSLAVLALVLAGRPLRAEEPDEAFIPIYTQIQDAESLEAEGQNAKALTKYQDALAALKGFQRNHPDWNVKVVNTRLNRLSDKIAALSQSSGSPAAANTNAPGGSSSAKASAATAEGAAKLLEPGAEPRKVLRLHPKAGDKQTLEMSLQMTMDSPMKIPAIKVSMDLSVKTVSPDGDIAYEIMLTDAGVAEEPGAASPVAEIMKGPLASLKGLSGTGTVTDRGVSKALTMKMPANADPASRQTLEQMKDMMSGSIMPLPEAAVGAGAKWEVRKVSKVQGLPLTQTLAYELVSMDGERLTLKNTVSSSASNQKTQAKMTGTGTGDLTYDLGQLMPVELSAKQHVENTMTMGGPQKQTMTQKMDVELHLQAK